MSGTRQWGGPYAQVEEFLTKRYPLDVVRQTLRRLHDNYIKYEISR